MLYNSGCGLHTRHPLQDPCARRCVKQQQYTLRLVWACFSTAIAMRVPAAPACSVSHCVVSSTSARLACTNSNQTIKVQQFESVFCCHVVIQKHHSCWSLTEQQKHDNTSHLTICSIGSYPISSFDNANSSNITTPQHPTYANCHHKLQLLTPSWWSMQCMHAHTTQQACSAAGAAAQPIHWHIPKMI